MSKDEKADKVNIGNRQYWITEDNFADFAKTKIIFNCANKHSCLYDATCGGGGKD